jgi:hypothetical protein
MLLYGNRDAVSASDGGATFDLFFDFEAGDLSGWTDVNGVLSIDGPAREGARALKWDSDIIANFDAFYSYVFSSEVRDLVVEWSAMAELTGRDDLSMFFALPGGSVYVDYVRETDKLLYLGSSAAGYASGYVFPANQWHDFEVIFQPSLGSAHYRVYDDIGNLVAFKQDVTISNSGTSARQLRIAQDQWYAQHRVYLFDRIRIRKYAFREPYAKVQ